MAEMVCKFGSDDFSDIEQPARDFVQLLGEQREAALEVAKQEGSGTSELQPQQLETQSTASAARVALVAA